MPLAPGTLVEECSIIHTLGAGGFGITYKAWDNRKGREVALKENFPSWLVRREPNGELRLTGDAKEFAWTMRHFIDEARILARLNHPNIVRVYRAFECNGTAYFVMEHLNATGLNKKCGAAYWSEDALQSLIMQLLHALKHLHKNGIFHRDIKPANIMLRHADNSPVLIDFGAAKNGPSRHTYTCGFVSMGYTSPEQLADSGALSPGIDIYSLGATLYCLLTGTPPPNASARLIKDEMIPLRTRRDLQARYSQALLASIDKALALDPAHRHPSAEHWLLALRQQSPKPSPIPPNPEPTPPKPDPFPTPQPELPVPWHKILLYSSLGCFGTAFLILIAMLGVPDKVPPFDSLFCPALCLGAILLPCALYLRAQQID